ncbi:MAG: fibronectin type III domain-containing protein [Treponemataceae bacterium]|nr:fibronectin type III domain-containing protein [Treponemataceae bacterium]
MYSPNKNGVYPVKITWIAPAGDDIKYYIYRSKKTDGGFQKLTAKPIEETEYIDANTTAKPGEYYYYKVISLNSLNQGNKGNDPANDPAHNARGYGALTADQWFREYNKTTVKSQTKLTLMHKPNNLDKVGSETISGDISGTLGYTAKVQGLGARITMPYVDYADFYVTGTQEVYFKLNGNTNTTSDMSANGSMDGTVVCTGMYPGNAGYDAIEIKGGGAGGGYYAVTTRDLGGNVIFSDAHVDWLVGEER